MADSWLTNGPTVAEPALIRHRSVLMAVLAADHGAANMRSARDRSAVDFLPSLLPHAPLPLHPVDPWSTRAQSNTFVNPRSARGRRLTRSIRGRSLVGRGDPGSAAGRPGRPGVHRRSTAGQPGPLGVDFKSDRADPVSIIARLPVNRIHAGSFRCRALSIAPIRLSPGSIRGRLMIDPGRPPVDPGRRGIDPRVVSGSIPGRPLVDRIESGQRPGRPPVDRQ